MSTRKLKAKECNKIKVQVYAKIIKCLSPGSNRGPLVCETSVITDYTTQTNCRKILGQASSGYKDELLWAAAWLHRSTDDKTYLDYLGQAGSTGGATTLFAWDDKLLETIQEPN
ncbi:hypothetical protein C1H46_019189 [Malus baccata]|uniref:cellulase n=1 Tax=Malus baccata TaxID=106549 RepID=A0A540M906_MALBA|nr:hypothetical protein C1H46_019189 [Malus baccata]